MSCIVVFGRPPIPGRVKTRLASGVGDRAAAAIYSALLEHTLVEALAVGDQVVLSLAEDPRGAWSPPPRIEVEIQGEGDLGYRLAECFERRFDEGRTRVLIVGSDCAWMAAAALRRGLAALANHRVVLGPATDGGYWAVGQRAPCVEMFESIPWSSPRTMARTRAVLTGLGVDWFELEELSDLDTPADLARDLDPSSALPAALAYRLRRAAANTEL